MLAKGYVLNRKRTCLRLQTDYFWSVRQVLLAGERAVGVLSIPLFVCLVD